MNNLKLSFVIVGTCIAILMPLIVASENEKQSVQQQQHEVLTAQQLYDLIHNKLPAEIQKQQEQHQANFDGSAELDESDLSMDKRYRLMGKRDSLDETTDEDDMDLEKRYRLMGKRYRLMGKRYRLMGKRDYEEEESNEDDDNLMEKRYRLMGKRYRLMGPNQAGKRYRIYGRK